MQLQTLRLEHPAQGGWSGPENPWHRPWGMHVPAAVPQLWGSCATRAACFTYVWGQLAGSQTLICCRGDLLGPSCLAVSPCQLCTTRWLLVKASQCIRCRGVMQLLWAHCDDMVGLIQITMKHCHQQLHAVLWTSELNLSFTPLQPSPYTGLGGCAKPCTAVGEVTESQLALALLGRYCSVSHQTKVGCQCWAAVRVLSGSCAFFVQNRIASVPPHGCMTCSGMLCLSFRGSCHGSTPNRPP